MSEEELYGVTDKMRAKARLRGIAITEVYKPLYFVSTQNLNFPDYLSDDFRLPIDQGDAGVGTISLTLCGKIIYDPMMGQNKWNILLYDITGDNDE